MYDRNQVQVSRFLLTILLEKIRNYMITSSVNQLVTNSLQPNGFVSGSGSFGSGSGSFGSGSFGSGSYGSGSFGSGSFGSGSFGSGSGTPHQQWVAANRKYHQERNTTRPPWHPAPELSPMESRDVWLEMKWEAWRNTQIKASGSYSDGHFEGIEPPLTQADFDSYKNQNGNPNWNQNGNPNVGPAT